MASDSSILLGNPMDGGAWSVIACGGHKESDMAQQLTLSLLLHLAKICIFLRECRYNYSRKYLLATSFHLKGHKGCLGVGNRTKSRQTSSSNNLENELVQQKHQCKYPSLHAMKQKLILILMQKVTFYTHEIMNNNTAALLNSNTNYPCPEGLISGQIISVKIHSLSTIN